MIPKLYLILNLDTFRYVDTETSESAASSKIKKHRNAFMVKSIYDLNDIPLSKLVAIYKKLSKKEVVKFSNIDYAKRHIWKFLNPGGLR